MHHEQSCRADRDPIWKLSTQRTVRLGCPFLVGILNITPDSFADGGELCSVDFAVDRARAMVDAGADMLDIGGESTRPGALRVDGDGQIGRVVPVIEAIRGRGLDIPISVDTTRASVALAALEAGGDVINDVSGGSEDAGMLGLAADRGCGLVLMHRVVEPGGDRYSDQYSDGRIGQGEGGRPIADDVVGRVVSSLARSRDAAVGAGVDPGCIVLDPGLGFGKDVEQNLSLIGSTGAVVGLGHPVMSALSRKSFVGRVSLGRDSDPGERLAGTLGLSAVHLVSGARIFRVHDVGEHRAALDSVWAVMGVSDG